MSSDQIRRVADLQRRQLVRLASSAAHTLNNSLTTVLLNLDTAARELDRSGAPSEAVTNALLAARSARRTVHRMQMFSADRSATICDPRAIADAVLAMLTGSGQAPDRLTIDYRRVRWVECRPSLIACALHQLLQQALGDAGDEDVELTVDMTPAGRVQWSVRSPSPLASDALPVWRHWLGDCSGAVVADGNTVSFDVPAVDLPRPRVLVLQPHRDRWALGLASAVDAVITTRVDTAIEKLIDHGPFSAVIARGVDTTSMLELLAVLRAHRPGDDACVALATEHPSHAQPLGVAALPATPSPSEIADFATRCRADLAPSTLY